MWLLFYSIIVLVQSIESVMPKHSISGSCHEADEKEVPDCKFQKLADPNIYQGLGVENSVHKAKCIFDNISSGEHLKLKNNYTNSHEKHQQKTNSICRPLCKQNNCDRLPDHDRIRYDSNRKQGESSVSTNVKHGTETKEHTVVKPQSSLAVNEIVIQENNSKISANSSSSTFCQDSNNRKEILNLGDVACQDATFKNKQKIVACDGKYQQDKTLKVNCDLCQDTKHNKKNVGLNVSVPQSSNSTHDINTESNFVNKRTDQTQERLAISDNVKKCTDHQMIKEDNDDDLSQYADHTESILAYHGSKKQNHFVLKIVVNDVTKHQNVDPIQKTMPTATTVSQDALNIENVSNKKHACARKKISVAENILNKETELKRVKLEVPDTLKCMLDLGDERVESLGSNDYKKQSTNSRESAPESNACIIKGMNPREEEVTDEVNEKQNFHYNHGLLQKIKPDTLSVDKMIKQLTDFRQEIYVSGNTVNNCTEPSQAKFGPEDTIYQDTEFRKELLSTDDTESQNVIFRQKTLVNDDTASLNIGSKEVMVPANNEPVQEALPTDNIMSQNTEPNQVTLEFNCTENKDTNLQQQQITSVFEIPNPVSGQTSCQIPGDDNQSCQSICSENAHASVSIQGAKISECDESSREKKKSVSFNGVTVYYFPRIQGFSCVPSKGGSTLGMDLHHCGIQEFSLEEHAEIQKRLHHHSILFRRPCKVHSGGSDTDESEVSDLSDSEFESENIFIQPVPVRQRRVMLRASGVQKIDSTEKEVCKEIRLSRELCGCDCKLYCDPEKCICSRAGIKCQVDRLYFPCGCSKDGCRNIAGRIEFNPVRVQSHILTTLMRVQSEKQQKGKKKFCFTSTTKNTKLEVTYKTTNMLDYKINSCLDIQEHREENVDIQTSPSEGEETFTCIRNRKVPLPECDVSVQYKEIISNNALSKKLEDEVKEKQCVKNSVNTYSVKTNRNLEDSNNFIENHSNSEYLTVIGQTVSLSESTKVENLAARADKTKDAYNESLAKATNPEYLTVGAKTLPSLSVTKTKDMSNDNLEESNSSGDLTVTTKKVTSTDSPGATEFVVEIIKQNLYESVIA